MHLGIKGQDEVRALEWIFRGRNRDHIDPSIPMIRYENVLYKNASLLLNYFLLGGFLFCHFLWATCHNGVFNKMQCVVDVNK